MIPPRALASRAARPLARAPGVAALLLLASPAEAAPPAPVPPPAAPTATVAAPAPPPPTPAPLPNRPPRFPEGPVREIAAKTGVPLHVDLIAVDPEVDALTYGVAANPPEASFVAHHGPGGSATLDWTPGPKDVGTHEVVIHVSDGKLEAEQTLRIQVAEEWAGVFVPSLQYTSYLPAAVGKWGFFQGPSAEIRAYSWIRRSPSAGPSHGSIYLDLDLLASTRANVANAFHLSTGVELSFESNPTRSYLLPVFGLALGALFQRQFEATIGELTPTAGVYLWASPRVTADLRLGYLLPLSAASFDDLRGLRAKLGVSVSLW